jgi:hypothetical protein
LLRCVPGERAKLAGIAVTISAPRPGRFVTRLGIVVPNERLTVFRTLIGPVAKRDIPEQQQRTANKKESSTHGRQFSKYSKPYRRTLPNAEPPARASVISQLVGCGANFYFLIFTFRNFLRNHRQDVF